jgi:hypothetical protein
VRRIVGCGLALLLALPALRGEARPQDEKEPPPQKRYATLLKDFTTQRGELVTAINKAKGAEQQKLVQQYLALGKEFAEKFYKLAEDDSKGQAGTDALFWVLQNAVGSATYPKAMNKAKDLVDEMPLKDLAGRLNVVRVGNLEFVEGVLKRAEKDENDPAAGDLLAWAAVNNPSSSAGQKATQRLIEKYPDHPAVERVCQALSNNRTPKAGETLKQILEKSTKPRVKAAAAVGLGKRLADETDSLDSRPAMKEAADKTAAEAEKYLALAIDLYGKDTSPLRTDAERALKALRTLRVGKVAPEITATDLDEKEFKLSDYRGKVVLLDFWGNW